MSYLGKRQPELYGTTTAAELDAMLREHAKANNFSLDIFYTHIEGEAIGRIYQAVEDGVDASIDESGCVSVRGLCAPRLPACDSDPVRGSPHDEHR